MTGGASAVAQNLRSEAGAQNNSAVAADPAVQALNSSANGPAAPQELRKSIAKTVGSAPEPQPGAVVAPSTDIAPLKDKILQFAAHPSLRGRPIDEARQKVESQLEELAQNRRISREQQEQLRDEFVKAAREAELKRNAELAQAMERLVQENSRQAFNSQTTPQALEKAYKELREVAGAGTPEAEWKKIANQFEQKRQEVRQGLLRSEVAAAAKRFTTLDDSADKATVSRELATIRARYADVSIDENSLVQVYSQASEAEYNAKLEQAGWIERAYYQARRWVRGAVEWVSEGLQSVKSACATAASAATAVGGFLKSMSDSVGLSDLAFGLTNLVVGQGQLVGDLCMAAVGQGSFSQAFSNYGERMTNASRAVVGAVMLAGEVTGVTDLIMTVKHGAQAVGAYVSGDYAAARGHLMMASMHGVFAVLSAGSIAATVATGGAAAGSIAAVMAGRMCLKTAGQQVLKTAAKEFLEAGAKELGQKALGRMGSEAMQLLAKQSPEQAAKIAAEVSAKLGANATAEQIAKEANQVALQKVVALQGEKIARDHGERLAAEYAAKGAAALTEESVQSLGKEVGEKGTKELLQSLKLVDHIDDLAYDMLSKIRDMKPRDAAKQLADELGVSAREASSMVREMKRALLSGKSDEAIKEVLTNGVTKEISQFLQKEMQQSYKDTFRKALLGQLDEPWSKELGEGVSKRAKELGKSADQFADELVEAGWKGAKEGIEKATRELVEEGIERALKRLRAKGRAPIVMGGKDSHPSHSLSEGDAGPEEGLGQSDKEQAKDAVVESSSGELVGRRQFLVALDDGTSVLVTEVYDNVRNCYVEVGRTKQGAAAALAAKEQAIDASRKNDFSLSA
jgi:hypothetical protein